MSAALTCPFCASPDIEDVAQWGGQIITRQCRCRACNTYFEAIRDEFDGPDRCRPPSAPSTSPSVRLEDGCEAAPGPWA